MKIYTKTGDKGTTALIGGARVRKDHPRIEAYGTVDELNAVIGLLRDHLEADDTNRLLLLQIQEKLFRLESHLADGRDGALADSLPPLNADDAKQLETEIDRMNGYLPPLAHFILPGGHVLVSFCHLARTVCRRAERVVTSLASEATVNDLDLIYLNRLSDYFFVLGRHYSYQTGSHEILWKP
ncbi:cob(I)yrinic acid a,c-diamide adenosyltransferase [Bacteroidales bacterium]